jgi:TRAP-type uncharacterized transport system substrate-binding protein
LYKPTKEKFLKKLIISLLILTNSVFATDFGTLATASATGKYFKLGQDISSILKNYNISLKPINTGGSYENMDILNGKFIDNHDTFFAIVQKDAISYYNYLQYSNNGVGILDNIPAVLSMGIEQIHLITLDSANFDYDKRKTFKVWCGDENGGSCITAKYIEKAYDFNFVYINASKENRFERLKEGVVDIVISVIESPATDFAELKGFKLIDLPTNFIMEDMYTHSVITKKEYPWISEDIHAFAVPRVLVTNLSNEKYNPIITNLTKILILNQPYMAKTYGTYWDKIDFSYTSFKKMSPPAKEVISQSIVK